MKTTNVIRQLLATNLLLSFIAVPVAYLLKAHITILTNHSINYFISMYLFALPVTVLSVYKDINRQVSIDQAVDKLKEMKIILTFVVLCSILLAVFPFIVLSSGYTPSGRAGLVISLIRRNPAGLWAFGGVMTFSAGTFLALSAYVLRVLLFHKTRR